MAENYSLGSRFGFNISQQNVKQTSSQNHETIDKTVGDFKYVMDNRCGEVVMKKLIAPEYEVKIGDCYYLLSKVNGEKTCWIIPCRFGCRSMELNKTCLNEINKYVQNSK